MSGSRFEVVPAVHRSLVLIKRCPLEQTNKVIKRLYVQYTVHTAPVVDRNVSTERQLMTT